LFDPSNSIYRIGADAREQTTTIAAQLPPNGLVLVGGEGECFKYVRGGRNGLYDPTGIQHHQ